MHELGLTREIVAMVAGHAGGRRVRRVVLEVGTLAGVMTDAVAFCFDAVAEGTALEGAVLEIRRVEARGRCRRCGAEFVRETLHSPCACGSFDVEGLTGAELRVLSYEIGAPEAAAEGQGA
ncbi:MAG: hydrogenase maturation nickel metallochaperone HypA [Alphaproteobacteria bacterium]|nr:hydrogenase maturation nickel metallochaperone HypA [Alphaproteobacteria bacterium]